MNGLLFIMLMAASFAVVLMASTRGRVGLQCAAVALALTSTVISGKIIPLWGLTASAGTATFTAIFLALDLIAECHGKRVAYQTVLFTFGANIVFLGLGLIVVQLQEAEPTATSTALKSIFSWLPRLLAGGLTAFLISQLCDIAVFLALKRLTQGKHLWLRTSGSTLVSQAVDTVIVWHIAFYGIIDNLWSVILVAYLTKVAAAFLEAPFCYVGRALNPEFKSARSDTAATVQEANA